MNGRTLSEMEAYTDVVKPGFFLFCSTRASMDRRNEKSTVDLGNHITLTQHPTRYGYARWTE